jgi:hypothetical protein
MEDYLTTIRTQFNDRVSFVEKRKGIFQFIAPFYHEDGDMLDIFIEETNGNGRIKISDHGMTLMRLSYELSVDTPNKERIFQKILSENQINEINGRLFIETDINTLYPTLLQFIQGINKVSNMRLFKREVIKSLFYELLNEFVMDKLKKYGPVPNVMPIPDRDDLEVDYELRGLKRPIYIFGIKDNTKARLTTISCLEFQKAQVPFKSIVVHEDFDDLPRKDRKRITSAADKQFTDLKDFETNGEEYLKREAA